MIDSKKSHVQLHSLNIIAWTISLASLFAGCSKPIEKTEDVRPVRVITLGADSVGLASEYSGEVRPRVESRLGFRVPGKVLARKVDVGDLVKRGQVLLQLDSQDLQLAQAQAAAGLKMAESNRDFASAEQKRYVELRQKNFVSQAVLDAKNSAHKAAQASFDQAHAAYQGQSNQFAYAALVSDVEGVVTQIDAEVGQVVAAGAPVVRVAQLGEKEVVIHLPEDRVDILRSVKDVQVRLWANPNKNIPGKIREISPIADPATRSYTAKVAIPSTASDVKLGMTAFVRFQSNTSEAVIRVPLTALFQEKGVTSVWVVENGMVHLVPVKPGLPSRNDLIITGAKPGQIVVTAGVNLLKPGQKVKILGDDTTGEASVKAASVERVNAAAQQSRLSVASAGGAK